MTVPLLLQERPDAPFLEALDRYARGTGTLDELLKTIEVILAGADWTAYGFERRRLEGFQKLTLEDWQAKAYAWRVTYGIEHPPRASVT